MYAVADLLKKVLEVDYVVLGGGNAKLLKALPNDTRLGDNRNAFSGGLRIWEHADDPLVLISKHRRRIAAGHARKSATGRGATGGSA